MEKGGGTAWDELLRLNLPPLMLSLLSFKMFHVKLRLVSRETF